MKVFCIQLSSLEVFIIKADKQEDAVKAIREIDGDDVLAVGEVVRIEGRFCQDADVSYNLSHNEIG